MEMEIKFDSRVKIKDVNDGIYFTDGSYLEAYHYQDCCESVYADFDNVKDEIPDIFINGFGIEFADDYGINLLLYPNFENKNVYIRLFIPCYDVQNGYYSGNLELQYHKDRKVASLDISNATQQKLV